MRAIDIGLADLETVRRILREHTPELEVRAFGSRVSWTARGASDLDLALMTAEPLNVARMAALKAAFTESDLPFRVDIVDWARTSENFREVIEKDHVVLVAAGSMPLDGRSSDEAYEWTESLLGELTDNFDAIRVPVKQADRRPGPYPYYGASGIVDHIDDYLFNGKYLLIAEDGENLRTRNTPIAFLANGKFWVNNHAHIVRGNHKANTRYLMYALSELDVSGYLTGSTMPKLTQGNMNRIRLATPSLPEQRAIAHILSTLDDKIELNRRMNETLEAMARALFKSWFVDFDPVRAKMEGRDPGLPQDVAELFPDRLVESEVDRIPEGWELKALGECFALTMGQSPPGSSYNDQGKGLPFFQGRTDFGFRYPENRKFCTAPSRIARTGDTLVSVRAPVGDINMAWTQCCIGRGVAALRHNSDSSSFTYYSAWTIQDNISAYEHTGTVFGAINRKQFEVLQTLEPRSELIEAFEAHVSPMDLRIRVNTLEIRSLTKLRDALVPRLISGDLLRARRRAEISREN